MLNVIYGVLAMVPTTFGVRHCAVPNVGIAPLACQTC
jgi:hypothetical protein